MIDICDFFSVLSNVPLYRQVIDRIEILPVICLKKTLVPKNKYGFVLRNAVLSPW